MPYLQKEKITFGSSSLFNTSRSASILSLSNSSTIFVSNSLSLLKKSISYIRVKISTAITVKAMNAKNFSHVKLSFEIRNQIIVIAPPDAAPYKADTTDMDSILKNGFCAFRNNGLNFLCVQLQPPHIINDVSIPDTAGISKPSRGINRSLN